MDTSPADDNGRPFDYADANNGDDDPRSPAEHLLVQRSDQDLVDEAVATLLRHVRGAPGVHFGDSRERSASISQSVHRLSDADLRWQYKIYKALASDRYSRLIPRDKRTDVYDVGHEFWHEDRYRKEHGS